MKAAILSEFRRVEMLLRGATGITAISQTFLSWALQRAGRKMQDTDGVFHMGYPTLSLADEARVQARRSDLIVQHALNSDKVLISFVGTFVSSFKLDTVIEAARRFQEEFRGDSLFHVSRPG